MIRNEIKAYMKKNKNSMAENHLSAYFTKEYQGIKRTRCEIKLKKEHDNSLLYEELEENISIKLTEIEKEYAKNRFAEAVLRSLCFDGASLYIDLDTNKEYKKSIE